MSDFRIKVSVDLDTSDINKQLDVLDKDYNINPKVDMSNIKEQIQTIKKEFQNAFKFTSKDLSGLDKLIKTLAEINGSNTSNKPIKQVSSLIKEYKELSNTVTKLQKQLSKGGLGEDSLQRTHTQIEKIRAKMDELKSQMSSSQKESLNLFNIKNENKELIEFNDKLNKIETTATSLQTKLKSISFDHIDIDIISKLEDELKNVKDLASNMDISFKSEHMGDLLTILSKIKTEITNLEKVENLASSFDKIASSANEIGVEIKDLDGIISNLSSEASNLDGSFDRAFSNAKSEASQLKNEIKEIESAMNSASKNSKSFGKSVFGTMDDFIGNFKQFTLAEVAGDFISDGIRTAVGGIKDTVVETDAAIIDLEKVYGKLDAKGLKTYLLDVTEVAKGTGQTSIDIINGTTKAVQSGIKNMDDALAYTKQAAIFSNVGDIDQELADTIVTSIMSAYGGVENALKPIRENIRGMGEDYNTLTKFTDLANYAGNNFAVSTADVGVALQQSAAALQANGVSMEESVGMVVAMNEVLQDASKSGNALKSISSNLAGVAVSAKDGTLQSNKTAKALKEIANIDVWDKQTGQVKDMYQVMDELYQKWDDLSEAERNALGSTIAGKTQLNAFNALMSNWEKANQLVKDYKNGLTIGSAEEENLAYLDSIQGKWNAIKENLKSIVNSIITSDLVKKVLDVIEQITAKIAEFASSTNFGDDILGLGAVVASLGAIGVVTSKLTGVAKAVKTLLSIGKTASTISTVATSLGKLGGAATTAGGSVGGVKALASALGGIGGTTAGIVAVTAAVVGLAVAIGDSTKAMSKLQESETGVGDAIASGSEMMNGAIQSVAGTGWKFLGGAGKTLGAIVTGQFSEIDDIWKETSAKINTSLNEGLSDATATTATALQIIKKSTQSELSDVHDIYNNTFSKLPNLTATNMNDVANTLVEQTRGMNSDMLLVCRGMGGEIGATLFRGITQSMGDSEKRKQFERNLKTLINSEIIVKEEVGKIVETFNVEYEKALDSHSSFKQGGTDVFNQLKKGLRNGDLKDACQDASKEMSDWTNDTIEKQKTAGKAWSALLDGITEDMTDKERYKKMKKNLDEYMDEYNLTMDQVEELLRDEQIEMHAKLDMEFEAEQSAKKTKAEIQQQFEDLDLETRVKLATEFNDADSKQLAIIYDILNRFPKEIQTKLKTEGYKEYLAEAKNMEDFLQKLPEEKLIELISDTQFRGELTPEELKIAIERVPDEKLSQLLLNTKYLNSLSPEELAIMLNALPEEKRIELITQYINSGKRTPEQIGAALSTLPTEKIIEIITEYKENGATDEKINKIIQSLPPEIRSVVEIALKGGEETEKKVEEIKEKVEEVPKEKTTTLKVKEENPGKTEEVKEELEIVDSLESNPKIKVEKEGEEPEQTKEGLNTLDNKEANPKINPLSDNSGMYMTDEQLNIMDNKEVNPKVKTKSDDEEIDETNKKLEETDGKTATANVEVKVNAPTTSSGDEGMYTDKNALLKVLGLSENQTVEQTVEVKAEVTGVDTSGVAQIKIDPIKITAVVEKVDTTTITNIKVEPIKITADSSNAMLKIQNVTQGLASIKDKTVKILADSSNAMSKITNITNGLNTISDKTVKILGDSSNATLKISNVTQGLASIKDKTVKILADSSNAMMKIQNVKNGLAGIKDKTVKILGDSSNAMLKIQRVKDALATLSGKTISLNVNKTVTESTVKKSLPTNSSTPMLTNSSLASVPVSASASPLSDTPVTISDNSLSSIPVSTSAKNAFGGTLDASKILSSLDFDISHIKNLEEALERLGNQLDFINEKAEATFGQEKVNLLNQQIPLLREQQKIQEQIAKNERAQNNELVYWLEKQGFMFDNLGNISNYNDKLLQMEKNVESLKEKYDALNNVSGDNKNEVAIKKANDAYEEANKTLSKTKKYLEEYFTTNNQELLEASQKWWEYENAIRDVERAVRDLANQQLQNNIDLLSDGIAFLDAKMGAYTGVEKLNIINQQNELYRRQQQALHVLAEQLRAQLSLMAQGTQEAIELQREINKLSTEWWDLESAIVGNNNEINDYYEDQRKAAEEEAERAREEAERAREEAERAAEEAKRIEQERKLNPLRDGLQEIRYELEGINNELSLLETLGERAQGSVKVGYLRNEIDILNKKLVATEEEFDKINKLRQGLMSELTVKGFSFDADGSIFNFDENLGLLAGTEEYEEAKQLAEEYMGLLTDDYNENRESIIEVQNTIKDLQDEIAKTERELALFSGKNRLVELNEEFEELANKLDIIDSKLEYAFGSEKITLIRKEVELLNNQLEVQTKQMETINNQMQVYTNSLSSYGFEFDADGDISNYQEIMEMFRDDEQVENIKELCEEYMDLCKEVEDLSSEYADLENAVKDAYKEMLDTTEDIEKEITEVIKKEYEIICLLC